jgi:hypothetical protein
MLATTSKKYSMAKTKIKMPTKKQYIPIHPQQKLEFVVFKRPFILLAPIPYKYLIPDLKNLKKWQNIK